MIGPEDSDILSGIERLRFSDHTVALDIDGNAGTAVKLLGIFLSPTAWNNMESIGVVLNMLDTQNLSSGELAQIALNAVLGPNPSHGAVVNLLYKNLTGSEPTAAVLEEFVGLLDRGVFTQVSLAQAAAEHDINATNIGLVGLQSTGIDYIPI